jgi:cardiolipin-specific phospholipase
MILEFGAFAKYPMKDKIKSIKVPTCWLYGQYDWMDIQVAEDLQQANELEQGSHIASVSKSGHHLYADNPLETVSHVVKFCLGEETHQTFLEKYGEAISKHEYNPNIRHPRSAGQ